MQRRQKKGDKMTFKGSIVVKRTDLLSMISNMKTIFKSNISDNSKWHTWGQQISYERILEKDISNLDWDKFMQWAWSRSWTASLKPAGYFDWLYSELSVDSDASP